MKILSVKDLKKRLLRRRTIIGICVTVAIIAALVTVALFLDGCVVTLTNTNTTAGTVSGSGRKASGSTSTLRAIAFDGYEFEGWINTDGTPASENPIYRLNVPNSNINLKATWSIKTYSLTCNIDSDTNTTEYPQTFTVESDTIYLDPPQREGYTFLGWYPDADYIEEPIDEIPTGTFQNITVYARWAPSYHITYKLRDVRASNNPANPTTYTEFTSVRLEEPFCYEINAMGELTGGRFNFIEWTDSDGNEIKSINKTLKQNITIYANWDFSNTVYYTVYQEEDGLNYMELGHYPNHIVENKAMVRQLKNSIEYADTDGKVLLDGDGSLAPDPLTGWYTLGTERYAIAIGKPYHNRYTFSDGQIIKKNEVYFFIVEPISWRVLRGDPNDTSSNSTLLLMASNILFPSLFRQNASVRSIEESIIYGNNWQYSDIRQELNTAFFNSAFMQGEASFVRNTTLNNNTTAHFPKFSNGKATMDKVFLLSYADMANRRYSWSHYTIKEDPYRRAKTTDYARALGIYSSINSGYEYNCGHWWLRSAGDFENFASVTTAIGTVGTYIVSSSVIGVRPAITVSLN